jgi:hypothetical protein
MMMMMMIVPPPSQHTKRGYDEDYDGNQHVCGDKMETFVGSGLRHDQVNANVTATK